MTKWRGADDVKRRMKQYGDDVRSAVKAIGDNYAAEIEREAKEDASWEDRTANARQGLFTVVEQENDRTTIYLSHQMYYGVYLELSNFGRYAIILPTLERFYPKVMGSVKRLLK